jgi:SAM-dependent methyltransferase
MAQRAIDFGLTAEDYAAHRAGFPDALFDRLAGLGVPIGGAAVLDLGTGTGTLARGFARRGARVTGLDPAAPLLEQARRLDAEAGVTIEYRVGRAEQTGLPAGAFDIVAAGQCWHWFDRPSAAAEAMRLLRTGGRLLHAHLDWLPLPGTVPHATEGLILRHNPAWSAGGGTGLHGENLADLSLAGFRDIETFSFDLFIAYTHEGWRGRVRASAGVGASLPRDKVGRFDWEHAALLAERFPDELLQVPHRLWAALATKP